MTPHRNSRIAVSINEVCSLLAADYENEAQLMHVTRTLHCAKGQWSGTPSVCPLDLSKCRWDIVCLVPDAGGDLLWTYCTVPAMVTVVLYAVVII